jgi:hypothetical protein
MFRYTASPVDAIGRYKVPFHNEIGIWYLEVGSGLSLIMQL